MYDCMCIYLYHLFIAFCYDPLPTWYPPALTTPVPLNVSSSSSHSSTSLSRRTQRVKLSRFLWDLMPSLVRERGDQTENQTWPKGHHL